MSVDTESGVIDGQALTVQPQDVALSMGPVMPIAEMAKMLTQLQQFIDTQLVVDTDYGLIPGAKQKSLWKPGAEKFTFWFGLGIEYVHVAGEVNSQRVAHTEGCRLTSLATDKVKAYVERSCNSDEENMQKAWLALQAKGFMDIRALDNTVRGMAQKRALVAATILATMASGFLSAHEGGEDEKREVGVNGGDRADWCSIHKSRMYRKEKDGRIWYSHKLPDGLWCNGPKKEDKPQAPAQPTEPAEAIPAQAAAPANAVPHFNNRGDQLTWIETQRKALTWTPQKMADYVKAAWMRSAVSQMTQDELDDLCSRLVAEQVSNA